VFTGASYGSTVAKQGRNVSSIYEKILACVVKLELRDQTTDKSWGVVIKQRIIMNEHAIPEGDGSVFITCYKRSGETFQPFQFTVARSSIIKVHDDMVAIVPGHGALMQFKDISAFVDLSFSLRVGLPLFILNERKYEAKVVFSEQYKQAFYESTELDFVKGISGSLIITMSEDRVAIVGIHKGVVLQTKMGILVPFIPQIHEIGVDKIFPPIDENYTISHHGPLKFDVELNAHSIAHHLVTHVAYHPHCGPVTVLGRDKEYRGRSDKATCRDTYISHLYKHHIPDVTNADFRSFTVRGENGEEVWVNSYLNALHVVVNQPVEAMYALYDKSVPYVARRMFQLSSNDKISGPLSFEQVIHGDGQIGISPVNLKAAAGAPYHAHKRDKVFGSPENFSVFLDKDILLDLHAIMDIIDAGGSPRTAFKWTYKDEPIKVKKILEGRTRVFAAGQFSMMWLTKMFFGPFFAWMKKHRCVLPCKVGINASSPEWDDLYKYFTAKFPDGEPPQFYVDGDYPWFDKQQYNYIIAVEVALEVYKLSGWTSRDLQVARALAVVYQHHMVQILGDWYEFNVGGASGQYGTAEFNSIKETLNQVHAYTLAYIRFQMEEKHILYSFSDGFDKCMRDYDFFTWVRLGNYGDDNAKAISRTVASWYTQDRHNKAFIALGFNMTDASDKTLSPVYKIDAITLSFLKRSFRYEPELGSIIAPLEIKSIWKMLCYYVPGDITQIEHSRIVCEEAQRHMFLHGKIKYESFISELEQAWEYMGKSFKIKTYEEQKVQYIECADGRRPYTFVAT